MAPRNSFLTSLFVLYLTASVSLGQDEPSCFESGEIGGSAILDMMPAEDAQDCLDNCKRMEDCEYFTYYDDTGDCYLFPYSSEFLTGSCQDCVSGLATCEDLVCWIPGTCSSGSEMALFGFESSDQCLEECQNDPDCEWFTYDTSESTCSIHSGDCDIPTSDCDTCYTSQKYCYRRLKTTRLTEVVIFGGFDADMDDNTDVMQLFNIESTSEACNLKPYPITAGFMATGFMVDGTVKSCGGEGGPNDYDLNDCYDYDPATNTWSVAPGMSEERVGMSSAHVEGGLWLLAGGGGYYGGTDETIQNNATSEVWDGEKFLPGPTLYGEYFSMHCQLGLDPTHVFIADGDTGHTWILDWETQEYIQQESMRPKHRPGCGKIVNKDGVIEVVVASDGVSEIFSLDSKTWRTGPDMPFIGNSFANDEIGDTFLLVGGLNDGDDTIFDTVYQFDPIHYQWILKPYRLDSPRFDSALLAVPKEAIQCP